MIRKPALSLRHRVFELLEPAKEQDYASKAVGIVIAAIILAAFVAVSLESIPELQTRYAEDFRVFEIFTVGAFTLEYLLRLWCAPCGIPAESADGESASPAKARLRYVLSFHGLVDLISILPFFLAFLIPGLDLRFLRVVRVLRILKISHYNSALEDLVSAIVDERKSFLSAAYILGVTLLFSSALIYYAENAVQPDLFRSIPHALWWSVITLTTVGYGDIAPVTVLGKIIGALTALSGVCAVALLTGIVAHSFNAQTARKRAIFEASLIKALRDGRITMTESSALDQLRKRFNIAPEHAQAILERVRLERVRKEMSASD